MLKKIVSQIREYVIAVKTDRPTLYEKIKNTFTHAIANPEEFELSDRQTKEFSHGREEIRTYYMLTNVNMLVDSEGKWKNLASVGMVCSQRIINGKKSQETRYYISSLSLSAEELAGAIRNHWSVENSCHWILDVAFNEDGCRIRKDNAPQNLAIIKNIITILFKQEKNAKIGSQK